MRKTLDIGLGLAVLSAVNTEAHPLTQQDIADVCGCSRKVIWKIEQAALAKMRQRLNELAVREDIHLPDLIAL